MSMHRTKRILNVLAILFVMLACGCASDRPPSGGPADSSPLRVKLSSPAPSEINVSTDRLQLTFNHYFTARQLVRALAFYPSVGQFDVNVDGRKAEIRFLEPLENNRTYTLFIDKNLKDFRGRGFSEPFSMSFSTGPSINGGTIRGKVYNMDCSPAGNALLLAYTAGHENRETGALLKTAPDYIAQTDASGTFSFRNLAPGTYRIFAVNDHNRDMRYSGPGEEIGLTASSSLPDGSSEVSIMLGWGPAQTGVFTSCRPLDRQHLEIRTTMPMPPAVFRTLLPEIRETASGTLVPVISWYGKNRRMREDEYILTTGPLMPRRTYRIGNPASNGIEFYGSGIKPQAKPPGAAVFPENGSDPAYLEKSCPSLGSVLVIRFSVPAEEPAVTRAVTLQQEGSAALLPFSLTAIDPYTWALKPNEGFKPGTTFKVTADMAAIAAPAQKKEKPPTIESGFTTSLPEEYGTITGNCVASAPFVIVEARDTASQTAIYRTRAFRDRNGVFRYSFTALPPGSYTIMAFVPSSENEPDLWRPRHAGSIDPYRPAEPFAVFSSPVNVRARWTAEHIDLSITK
jgi:hypothetical protein